MDWPPSRPRFPKTTDPTVLCRSLQIWSHGQIVKYFTICGGFIYSRGRSSLSAPAQIRASGLPAYGSASRRDGEARLVAGLKPTISSAATSSGCGPFTCAPRGFRPWNENVGRHAEARAQPLHHCQAQFLLASKHLADATRRTEQRNHFCPSELVLIHEMPDQFRCARAAARPLALLIGSN